MPRKRATPPKTKDVPIELDEGLAEALPAEARETMLQRAIRRLEEAIDTGDLNQAKLASLAITTLKKGIGERGAIKLKADERLVDGIRRMAEGEFCIPSQLAKYSDALVRRR